MKKDKSYSFEEALEQLDEIVTKLEEENVALDKLIEYYQKGMELVALTNQQLKEAEEKMTQILNENDVLEPFTPDDQL